MCRASWRRASLTPAACRSRFHASQSCRAPNGRPLGLSEDELPALPDVQRPGAAAAARSGAPAARRAALWAQAALTGKLADPTDLPFTDGLLDDDGVVDEAKVHAAVDELIKRKPHLAARRPTGNVGQGARPEAPGIGLAAMLRRGA